MKRRVNRRIFFDVHPGEQPKAGELLATHGVRGIGTVYLILASRQVKRRDPAARPRFTLAVQPYAPSPKERIDWWMRWYPRNRRSSPPRNCF